MTDYALRISEAEIARYRGMALRARQLECDAWTEAGFVAGAHVADVGCGPAAVLADIAAIVGAGGSAVGVERDQESADAAVALLADAGLQQVAIRCAPAHNTGLEDGSLDAVMVRHVLIHNAVDDDETGAPAILRHVRNLLRAGGCLYVVDTDLEAMRLDPPIAGAGAEHAARYHRLLRSRGCDPRIGPTLGRRMRNAGFEVVREDAWWSRIPLASMTDGGTPVSAARSALIAAGLASEEECDAWDAAVDRHRAIPDAQLFAAAFRVVGRRPG